MSIEVAKKAYFEAKRAHEAERNRLMELEKRLSGYQGRIAGLEKTLAELLADRVSTIQAAAIGNAPETKLGDINRQFSKAEIQLKDAEALREATELAIDQARRNLEGLQTNLAISEKAVWRAVIPSLKQELEEAIGDRLDKLWVAIFKSGSPGKILHKTELPYDLEFLATPHNLGVIGDELWRSIIN